MKGRTHSAETKMKISLALMGENNPNFGNKLPIETKTVISEAMKGKNLGKLHSSETKLKMSLAKKGIVKTEEHKEKIRRTCKGLNIKKLFVYSNDPVSNEKILYKCFDSCGDAAKELNVGNYTISRYLNKGKLLQDKWLLYSNPISCE
jgi:group I intron endonuclease